MDVTFIANDTRGGIEPYVALAAAVVARGHVARAVAPGQYENDFVSVGARFAPLAGVEQAQMTAHGGTPSLREMGRRVRELTGGWALDTRAFAEGTDLVISGIGGLGVARPVAEALGAGLLRAHLQPLDAPSPAYPGPLASKLTALGPFGNRLSHRITEAGLRVLVGEPERAARRALGLGTRPAPLIPCIIYGFSPEVVPVASDAAATRIATGYWTSVNRSEVAAELRAFVEQPGPVVSVGFGSMASGDARDLYRVVTEAVRRVGVRAVILTGWGAMQPDAANDPNVCAAGSVPYTWLFPRMAATVHHGGAGTTGAALMAGKPTVIVPFGADQPFWGLRAHQLGVAPAPIPRGRLSADRLARALGRTLADEGLKDRARALGARLQQEEGVRAAVDVIEASGAAGA